MQVSRTQVLAFRLAAHHLDVRLPAGRWPDAVRPLGLRTAVPGTAAASLHARAGGVDVGLLAGALAAGELVEVRSAHGTLLVPPVDVPVFTTGAVPGNERGLRSGMRRIGKVLDAGGLGAAGALELARAAADEILAAGPLDQGGLSSALTARLPAQLSPYCRACATEHVDNGLFAFVLLAGRVARQPGDGRMVRLADLPHAPAVPDVEPALARAELLRRVLRGHGPCTLADVAWWLSTPQREAAGALDDLADELVEVAYAGRGCRLLAADAGRLAGAAPVEGVRLVPPYDPLLTTGDRATLAPGEAARNELWRTVANSGAVIGDGDVVAAWRARKNGARLDVTVVPFPGWRARFLPAVREESAAVAALRGCAASTVADPAG